MSQYRKRPVVIEATQWFKNGDHPEDYARDEHGLENGELRVFTGAERKANEWEGGVVRYFRHPAVSGEKLCNHCHVRMHEHGWLDNGGEGEIVCPGDYVVTLEEDEEETQRAGRPVHYTAVERADFERDHESGVATAADVLPADDEDDENAEPTVRYDSSRPGPA